jgi:hypothetical protein
LKRHINTRWIKTGLFIKTSYYYILLHVSIQSTHYFPSLESLPVEMGVIRCNENELEVI